MRYVPRRDKVEQQIRDLAKRAPLSFLFKMHTMDHRGRVVATIGSLEEDIDGHIVSRISQNMNIESVFLATILDRAVSKFSVTQDQFVKLLLLSPVFDAEQERYLIAATQAYFRDDLAVAIHLYVPQIEAAVRNLVEITGGAVLKAREGGGFHLRTFDELLRTEQVSDALNEDVALYLRVVLTDQRGWNIRNSVCHGMFPYQNVSRVVVDRLMHILILFAQLRASRPGSSEK